MPQGEVTPHTRRSHRGKGTQGALEGLVPRVPPLVAPQVAVLTAPEVTIGALVGFDPGVGPLVLSDLPVRTRAPRATTNLSTRPTPSQVDTTTITLA
jgi:hypothetical protein